MFEVGDMVVCVDAKNTPGRHWHPGSAPSEGGIYTVREVAPFSKLNFFGSGVKFEEIQNFCDEPYQSHRFRKIKKPSIEIFRQIVASVKGDQNVNA